MGKAIVLGAYGLIGSACLRVLKANGFKVTGVGRSRAAGLRTDPGVTWVAQDIAWASVEDWAAIFDGADVVVNAAGALQDGTRDRLSGIHEDAVVRIVEALRGRSIRFVQISAAGASEDASTEFLRSKARGDAWLMRSSLDWVILRPTLVIGPQAYGGTALLRAAAAFPVVFARVLPDSAVQTVALDDVAQAVLRAAQGEVPTRTVFDLTEVGTRSLAETITTIRRWQGFAPWRLSVAVPRPLLRAVAVAADALGWLGWRSPLRSTALRTLEDGVFGDPSAWLAAGGAPCRSLEATLESLPSTVQERWFARMYLLLPLVIGTLSLFWMLSGLIGIAQRGAAQAVLMDRGLHLSFATLAVIGGSVIDLLLGLAVLWRPWARAACLGMVAVALSYLAGATFLAADLWADPLGPLLKVLPSIALALVGAALLDER